MRRIQSIVIIMALAVTAAASPLWSQTIFERLVMPGPVIEGHKHLEKKCQNCHLPFRKQDQTRICLDCHDKVAADRRKGMGFHGKNPAAAKQICKHCHTEHKGREADIVRFVPETFDHKFTDFALTGAHAYAPCASCHKPGKPHREAATTCHACHGREEPHKGRLGKKCENCHDTTTWRKTKAFDHDKTKFPLRDSHKKVACRTCHTGEAYKGIATTCIGCHALQDAHKGSRGEKCESCHKPTRWKEAKFDHARDANFPLRGAHSKARCESCHRGGHYKAKLPRTCNGCHGKADPHGGQLGKACQKCHNETSWRGKVKFDHDLTRFPLIGLHAAASCESCHKTKAYRKTERRCSACHQDSFHKGRLGPACETCHTPNGWRRWTFDHARQARYPLTGAHEQLDCHACHTQPTRGKVTAPQTCVACHRRDDVHDGRFGRDCARCHSTITFRDTQLRR